GRVRIAAQVGYSDVAPDLVAELRGRRQRGSVSVTLTMPAGRTLARVRDTAALDVAAPRDRAYQTYTALLDIDASNPLPRHAPAPSGWAGGRARQRHAPHLAARGRRPRVLAGLAPGGRGPGGTARGPARPMMPAPAPLRASPPPPYPCFGTAADLLAWNPSSA